MIQILDMWDHYARPNVEWMYVRSQRAFVIKVLEKEIEPWNDIMVSYGMYTDSHLFAKFGFVNGDGSGHTEVSIATMHQTLDVGLGQQYSFMKHVDDDGDTKVASTGSVGYIPTLMAHIVRRMARRHSLVMTLGVWVKAILAATARSSSQQLLNEEMNAVEEQMAKDGKALAGKLGPLKNFLNERVESFPQLLRLEGRLSLLNQQL